MIDLSQYCNADSLWGICQVFKEKDLCPLPTWNAFNSLITPIPTITTCQVLPLYAGSPTDFTNLHHMLIAAQDINIAITGKCKTIVTLDLQLYAICMQMRENQFISSKRSIKPTLISLFRSFLLDISRNPLRQEQGRRGLQEMK